jgi:hypothetical protein
MRHKLLQGFSFSLFLFAASGCDMLSFDREKNCLNPAAACFKADATGPAVSFTTKLRNGLNPSSAIEVEFSEDLDTSTLTTQSAAGTCSENIQLSNDNFASCLTTSVTVLSSRKFSLSDPATNSIALTYNVKISDVKDKSGIKMASTLLFNFTVNMAPDSGQSDCRYDDDGTWGTGTVIDANCTQTYTIGSVTYPQGQDAHHNSGAKSFQLADGNQSVTETVSGISFARCLGGQTWDGTSCTGTPASYTLPGATAYCTALNSASYGGHTDWRMPTLVELATYLLVYGQSGGTLPAGFFNYANNPSYFRTNTPIPPYPYYFNIYIDQGTVEAGDPNNGSNFAVICIRGKTTNNTTFTAKTVSGGEVVASPLGNLTWTKCSLGNLATSAVLTGAACDSAGVGTGTWFQAIEACENLIYAGNSNWRLPNAQEMLWLFNGAIGSEPYTDSAFFPSVPTTRYWTATHYYAAQNSYDAGFNLNPIFASSKTSALAVRCVTDDPL